MEATLKRLIVPVLAALCAAAAAYAVRTAALRIFRKWSAATETQVDDIILESFRAPSAYWCIAIGLAAGLGVSDLLQKHIFLLNQAIEILVVLSITIAAANLAGKLLTHYIGKTGLPLPATGLAQGIIKGSIFTVGLLIILSVVGISITPIITALGVGGLAVALALKDTLENLFAGIHVLVEKSIRVGDFIRLDSGQEGRVEDITWRTTRIRTPANSMVIVPNARVTQSTLTNYHLPEKRAVLAIAIRAPYDADPAFVERIVLEETAGAAALLPAMLPEPAPGVKLIPGFGESALEFTLTVHVKEYQDQFDAADVLRRRILARFRREGIAIPYPGRTVRIESS